MNILHFMAVEVRKSEPRNIRKAVDKWSRSATKGLFVCLFVYGSCNDNVSSSNCLASNGMEFVNVLQSLFICNIYQCIQQMV
jgi:hypothetical protein